MAASNSFNFFHNFRNTIAGVTVDTVTKRHQINPANGEKLGDVPVATQEDVEKAMNSGQTVNKTWSKTTWEEGRKAVYALADAIEVRANGFGGGRGKEDNYLASCMT